MPLPPQTRVGVMPIEWMVLIGGAILFLILVAVAFSGPSEAKAQGRRINAIRERHSGSREAAMEAQMRKTIATQVYTNNSLAKLLPNRELLARRLQRTGKSWKLNKFLWVNVCTAIGSAMFITLLGAPFLLALFASLLLGLGIPHFVVSTLIKKRTANFVKNFPDAIDLLVRGLRSGLPISETLQVVAVEIPGPVGEEFKAIVDRIRVGRSMDAALQEASDQIATAEFQFFCITTAIQRETGGNLAETLSNLSDVLRKRAQMKLKVKALSSEAKASAYILGCLPFVIFALIYAVNPGYISGFFSNPTLIATGLGAMVWMSIGVAIMAKMINFEI